MFTGIIAECGTIATATADPRGGLVFAVRAPVTARSLRPGDSVAINGACHTVIRRTRTGFTVESMPETLTRTNLGSLAAGHLVNLERPVAATGLLDGHIVTGHVDAVAAITRILPRGNSTEITLRVPRAVARYIVEKGSVALDGISLTVARIAGTALTIAVIPHTWAVTNLATRAVGDQLNLETDILAKHVAKLIGRQ